jgi:hypothetical protein
MLAGDAVLQIPLQRDGFFLADQASQQTLPIADIGTYAPGSV